ncbi:hypothetical protein C8J57DRAFT_1412781, partial [Mycena rebaudengoi]
MAETETQRIHPCFRGDSPLSVQQPNLRYEVQYFMTDALPQDYPYQIAAARGIREDAQMHFHIPYFGISGIGPPPADLTGTSLGDLWLDLTPNLHAAYAKVPAGDDNDNAVWQRWYDPQPSLTGFVQHPHFKARMLWCSNGRISWVVKTTVVRNQGIVRKLGLVVAQGEDKAEKVRWEEASGVIKWALSGTRSMRRYRPVHASGSATRRTTRSGGELVQGEDPLRELVSQSIDALRDENKALSVEISAFERQIEALPAEESACFMDWATEVLSGGLEAQSAFCKEKLSAEGRRLWDMELAYKIALDDIAIEERKTKTQKNL